MIFKPYIETILFIAYAYPLDLVELEHDRYANEIHHE